MKKINYPGVRKSPSKHTVDAHKREGHTVHSYMRDAGKAQPRTNSITTRRRVDKVKSGVEGFTVTLKYKDGKTERIHFFAPTKDYKSAVAEALEERSRKEMPIAMDIVDPSIGKIMSAIGTKVGSGMRWSAKFAKKAVPKIARQTGEFVSKTGKATLAMGKELGSTFVTGVQKSDARRLIEDSYSNDKTTRHFARATLKRRYPELYDQCHFSPAKFKPPSEGGKLPKVSVTEDRARKIMKSVPRKIQGKAIFNVSMFFF